MQLFKRLKFMCKSKNEQQRSGRVTVMRFDAFAVLNEIKNDPQYLQMVADLVLQLITKILIHSVSL